MTKILKFFPSAPVFENEDKTTEARLTYTILVSLFAITALTGLTPLFVRDMVLPLSVLYAVLFGSLGAISGMLMLLQRGHIRPTNWILVSIFWAVITGLVFATGGLRSQAFFGYFAIIALASLLLGGRVSLGVTFFCVGAGGVAFYIGENHFLPSATLVPPLTIVWFSASAYLIILAVLQNLASRTLRQALQRARTSETQYRRERDFALQVMNSIGQGLTITGPQGIEFVNPAFTQMTGYSPEKLLGSSSFNITPPEDHPILNDARSQRQKGETNTYEIRLQCADGKILHTLITAAPRWEQDRVIGAISTITDLSERKRIEESLRQSEENLKEFLEKLKALHEINIELSKPSNLGEFFYKAVDLGRTQLGFDRMGLFLFEDGMSVGTYGTDREGNTLAINHLTIKLEETPRFQTILEEKGHVRVWDNVTLYDNRVEVGFGWNAFAVMWNGDQPIGFIATDNLLHQQPYQPHQEELLRLYSITLSHLFTRKQAEEAVRASEALYRQAIEAADAVPYRLEHGAETYEKPYPFMGEGIGQLTGYSPHEMTPEIWNSLILESKLRGEAAGLTVGEAMKRAREGKLLIWQCDYRIRTRNGETRWVADTAVEILNEQGSSKGSIGILQDITDRKLAEEAIEKEHYLLRTIIDNLPDYIYLKDTEHRCLVSNVANARSLGTTPEEIIGKTLANFYPPEVAEQYNAKDRGIMATGQRMLNQENTFIDIETNMQRWTLMSRVPFYAPDGTIVGIIGITHDITDYKKAEMALAEQAQETAMLYQVAGKLAQVAGNLYDLAQQIARMVVEDLKLGECGVWLVNEERNILQRVAYFGSVDKHFNFDIPLDGPGLIATSVRAGELIYIPDVRLDSRYLVGDPATLSEMVVPLKIQERIIGVLNVENHEPNAIHPRQQRVIAAFAERATLALENARLVASLESAIATVQQLNLALEQRVLERTEALEQRTLQLETANHELEAFSYSVSHDLRGPLRAIDGFSNILIDDYAEQFPSEAQHYLHRVREGAQRMNQLVNDLLAFSRITRKELNKRETNPTLLVREVLDELQREQIGRTIDLVIGDLPLCYADPSLLRQVYANLISNALKFTRQKPSARIEIGAQIQNSKIIYFVRDNGAGFNMQFVDKLFGVFQRLHTQDEFEGTGIGLANVKRIITRHGGRIWAEAEINQGAVFYFTLE